MRRAADVAHLVLPHKIAEGREGLLNRKGLGGLFTTIVGVLLAIAFGVMFFNVRDILVMLSTALSGAGLVLTGLAILLPSLLGWLSNQSNLITFVLPIVLAAAGFSAQSRSAGGRQVYGAMRI